MTSYASIYRERNKIVDMFFHEVEEAQLNRQKEFDAAVLLQSVWRRHIVLRQMTILHYNANLIQNIWRRYRAQIEYRCRKVEKETKDRIAFFNQMARIIQKTWRGYDCRRHVFDFYKQKGFLNDVQQKNNEMNKMLDNHYAQTAEMEKTFKEEASNSKNLQNALKSHYLVSTAAIPSIFQPPAFTKDAAAMPAIEQFIRTVNKARIVIPSCQKKQVI